MRTRVLKKPNFIEEFDKMMEFYGLLGIIGEKAEYLLKNILNKKEINTSNLCLYKNSAFWISKNHILDYPPIIDINDKSLILFGNPFVKHLTLDKFLSNPYEHLAIILTKYEPEAVPLQFTNGAYVGVIREGSEYIIFNDFFQLLPLYYSQVENCVVISTSFRLLSSYIDTEADINVINEYLTLGHILSQRTIKKGISTLPPASIMRIKDDREIKIKNYATYPDDNLIQGRKEDIAEEVNRSFRQALQRLYSNRLKYCLNLSGGADTRLIFFEWPDRNNLLTETAGEDNSSDVLKAKELVKKYGNPSFHVLENLQEERYLEGFKKYYELSDNPLNLKQNFNYYHLQWKSSRGAQIRLFGAGEIFGGENLYLNRSPLYLFQEMIFPYNYHKLKESDRLLLIKNVLKVKEKTGLNKLLINDLQKEPDLKNILKIYSDYLGRAAYQETFTERFRTWIVALAGYLPFSEINNKDFILVSPYNDREFLEVILRYHPKFRELRRLQLYVLKKYHGYCTLPLDTTHLSVSAPYYFHKILRVPRFILNIGFHKKVPIFQKGGPPTERFEPYLRPEYQEFRDFIKTTIFNSNIFEVDSLKIFFKRVDAIKSFNFLVHHREITNLYLLFRLAYAYKTLI